MIKEYFDQKVDLLKDGCSIKGKSHSCYSVFPLLKLNMFSLGSFMSKIFCKFCYDGGFLYMGFWKFFYIVVYKSSLASSNIKSMVLKCRDSYTVYMFRSWLCANLERDEVSWTVLISGFLKKNRVEEAMSFYQRNPFQNVISWTAAISGLVQNGWTNRAMEIFVEMVQAGVSPNDITSTSTVRACAGLGDFALGMSVLSLIVKSDFEHNISVCNFFVTLNLRFGEIGLAQRIFDEMEERDIVSWTTILDIYVEMRDLREARRIFDEMPERNEVSLNAMIASLMEEVYVIKPKEKHYSCVIDMLSQSGRLSAVEWFITSMLCQPAVNALLYLEFPSSVLTAEMADVVQPLTATANKFLMLQDITKFQDKIMNLHPVGIEAILSSDDLQVASKDAIYDFVPKWYKDQYPKREERLKILVSRLCGFIHFPYMTCCKLKKVLTCNDFDHDLASRVVLEALFFKAEAPHRQRSLAAEESPTTNHHFVERAYKYRPVKVVEFEIPRQQCVIYLDLRREECTNLFPSGRFYSQAFHLGGQGFFLSAHCNMDQQSSFHCFRLFLGMREKGFVTFAVDYEFVAKSKPTEEYISTYKDFTFTT